LITLTRTPFLRLPARIQDFILRFHGPLRTKRREQLLVQAPPFLQNSITSLLVLISVLQKRQITGAANFQQEYRHILIILNTSCRLSCERQTEEGVMTMITMIMLRSQDALLAVHYHGHKLSISDYS